MEPEIVDRPYLVDNGVAFTVAVDGMHIRTVQYGGSSGLTTAEFQNTSKVPKAAANSAKAEVNQYINDHPDEMERCHNEWRQQYGGSVRRP